MTNFEKFKLMNIEELSEWLTQYGQFENSPWINWWNETYCKNCDTEITYVINPKTGIKSDKPSECTWCEIHNKCRYFQELDEVYFLILILVHQYFYKFLFPIVHY